MEIGWLILFWFDVRGHESLLVSVGRFVLELPRI